MINLVSSPGPMGPLPSESDYDELPYTLPPGPYTSRKPDVSYAALVGRAILSSPKHALTLQEIYDYITIVHSYFKRGEPTWMNSIRHVLSTTVVFRKIVRERREGRTLWGIWDEDLGCFDNGGFDKTKCREFVEGRKNGAPGSGSGSGRKRAADGDGERKPKRQRKSAIAAVEKEAVEAALRMQSTIPPVGGQQHSTSVFMLTKPTPHHQPYYETCVQQQPPHPPPAPVNLPAEVIFPPLPRMASNSSSYSEGYASTSASEPPSSAWDSEPPRSISPPAPSCSAASGNGSVSMPDLTPNGSSSSPPSASELEQELEMELELAYPEIDIDVAENGDMDDDERLFSEMLSADALEPGFTLNKHDFYEYERERGRMKGGTPPLKVRFPLYLPLVTRWIDKFWFLEGTFTTFTFSQPETQKQNEHEHKYKQDNTVKGRAVTLVPYYNYFAYDATLHTAAKHIFHVPSPTFPCTDTSLPQRFTYEPIC